MTVKPVYNDHPWDPPKVAVVQRWSVFGGFSIKIGIKISKIRPDLVWLLLTVGCCSEVAINTGSTVLWETASLSPNFQKFHRYKLWITTPYALTFEQRPLFGVPRVAIVNRFDCTCIRKKTLWGCAIIISLCYSSRCNCEIRWLTGGHFVNLNPI
jgi:hypothetical protein